MDIDNYNLDDNDNPAWDGTTGPDPEEPGKKHILRILFKTLTTPIEGWKEVRRKKLTSSEINSECFFPLAALAACSQFTTLIYHPSVSIVSVIIEALISFTSFFASLPCIILCAKLLLPLSVSAKLEEPYGKAMILMSLSSLALFAIPYEALPMLDPVMVFLPIWSIYIITKGVRFLKVGRQYETRVNVILSALTVGMPIFLGWLLTLILPKV